MLIVLPVIFLNAKSAHKNIVFNLIMKDLERNNEIDCKPLIMPIIYKHDDIEILKKVLENNQFSFSEILNGINSEEIKNKLKENTSLAVEKGVFGTPSFLIKNQLFFGKDSIHDLEDYLLSIK